MANPHVESFYRRRAKLYQRFFVRFLQWEEVLAAFFRANPVLHAGMKILDAGCGTGSVTKVLYRLANQQGLEDITFHGFDLTPAMLALFQEWVVGEGAQGIHLQQADVLDLENQLPRDWQDFDWIVSSTMLEYIPRENCNQALRNLQGLLKGNGQILLFLTKRTRITRWTGANWWGANLFEQDEVTASLQHAGFSTIQYHPLPKCWDSFLLAVTAECESATG